jgi:hypothetical protein
MFSNVGEHFHYLTCNIVTTVFNLNQNDIFVFVFYHKHFSVYKIAYGFGGRVGGKNMSSLIFYCKIPILCRFLAKFCDLWHLR